MAKRTFRGKILLGLALFLVAFVAVAFHRSLLTAMGDFLIEQDPLEKCDAAVVLSGEPGDGFRTRTAVGLYKEGWVKKIVLSGARATFGHHETDFSVPLAVSLGVPREDIIAIDHQAHSTLEEGHVILPRIEKDGIRSIIVVTSNFHTRRAGRYFRRVSQGRMRVLTYPSPDAWFFNDSWWQTREGLKVFFMEFFKNLDSIVE